jgi:hypothetical protein
VKLLPLITAGLSALCLPVAAQEVATTSASQAVTVFEGVCGGSQPSFGRAETRMKRLGRTLSAPDGQIILADTSISLKVFLEGQGNRACSVSFVTSEKPNQVKTALSDLGPIQDKLLSGSPVWVGAYEGEATFVSSQGKKLGKVTQYELVMIAPK